MHVFLMIIVGTVLLAVAIVAIYSIVVGVQTLKKWWAERNTEPKQEEQVLSEDKDAQN